MELYTLAKEIIFDIALAGLGLLLLMSLIKGILGPRFTDRILGINMISTQGILVICILTLVIGEQYLADIALIYAILGFLAVVAMSGIFFGMKESKVAAKSVTEPKLTAENTESKAAENADTTEAKAAENEEVKG